MVQKAQKDQVVQVKFEECKQVSAVGPHNAAGNTQRAEVSTVMAETAPAPTRRQRGKRPPPSGPGLQRPTAAKSRPQPPVPPLEVESAGSTGPGSPVEKAAEADGRSQLLRKLFRWPLYVIDVWCRWRTQLQSNPVQDFAKAAEATVQESRRQGYRAITAVAGTADQHNADDDKKHARSLLESMEEVSISTAFSGIDTPSTAMLLLGAGVCEHLGLDQEHLPRPRNLFAVEWLPASQQELLEHPHAPEHLYTDMEDFWCPAFRE